MKKILKILLCIFIFFIVAIIIFLVSLPFFQEDWIEPVPGVSLELKRPPLKREDIKTNSAMNHVLDMAKHFKDHVKNSELYQAEQTQDWMKDLIFNHSQVEHYRKLLQQSEKTFDIMKRAVRDPDPRMLGPISIFKYEDRDFVSDCYRVSMLHILKAQMLIRENKFKEATEIWKETIRFNYVFAYGGDLVPYLSSMGITSRVLNEIRKLLLKNDIPEAIVLDLKNFVSQLENEAEPLSEVFRVEIISINKTVEDIFDDTIEDNNIANQSEIGFWMKIGWYVGSTKESVTKNLNDCMTHFIHMSEQDYKEGLGDEFMKQVFWRNPAEVVIKNRDPVGFFLAGMFLAAMDAMIIKQLEFRMKIRSTHTFLALYLYNKKNKAMPTSLKELVPEYLDKLPEDPFHQKPISYKVVDQNRWMIYSVYKNTIDDGANINLTKNDRWFYDEIIRNEDYIILNKPLGTKQEKSYVSEEVEKEEIQRGRRGGRGVR